MVLRNRKNGLSSFEWLEPRLMLENTPPVAYPISALTIDEDSSVTGMVFGSDADNDSLRFRCVDAPSHGSVFFDDSGVFVYCPLADYFGSDEFYFVANDGLADSAPPTRVEITINGINDAPELRIALGGSANYIEDEPPAVMDTQGTWGVVDVDSADFDTGTLTAEFINGTGKVSDRLAIRNQGTGAGQIGVSGGSVTYGGTEIGTFTGGTTGSTPLVITFNANASRLAVQALLRNLTFEQVSDDPSTDPRTVQFTLTDGDGGTSAPATVTVNVIPSNDAPVLDKIESIDFTYHENDPAEAITAALTVTDPDSGDNIESATIQITANFHVGEDILEFADTASITGKWYGLEGRLVLTGSATPADYQAALRSVTYRNTSDAPHTELRTVTFTASDGESNSTTQTRQIAVTPVNDAPVNRVPAAQAIYEDVELIFSRFKNRQLSISDVDAGSSAVEVRLTATHGTIRLSGTTGLTFATGYENLTSDVIVTGTIANINSALEGLAFIPEHDYVGTEAMLEITTNDLAPGGSALSDTDGVAITVNSEPAVSITSQGPANYTEGAEYLLTVSSTYPVASWYVDWHGTGTFETFAGLTTEMPHTYLQTHAATIKVKALTDDGVWAYATDLGVTINDAAPTIVLGGEGPVDRNEPFALSIAASDAGNYEVTQWTIDWGDGSTPIVLQSPGDFTQGNNPPSQTHTFSNTASPSIYDVTVTAQDVHGSYQAVRRVSVIAYGYWLEEDGGTDTGEASTSIVDGSIKLVEGDSFYSALVRDFVVPQGAYSFTVSFTDYFLDTTDTTAHINDTLEVSLVDVNGNSLVPTIGLDRDCLFNYSEGMPVGTEVLLADGVMFDPYRKYLSADITDVPAGTQARLYVRLINNDDDKGSYVMLPAVNVSVSGASTVEEGSAYNLSLQPGTDQGGTTGRKFLVVDDQSVGSIFEYDLGGSLVIQGQRTSRTGNDDPRGAVYHEYAGADRDLLWVVDADGNVYVYDYSTGYEGQFLGSWTAQDSSVTLSGPAGIATDGVNLWIVDSSADKMYFYPGGASWTSGSYNASAVLTDSWGLTNANTNPSGLTFGRLREELSNGHITTAGTYDSQNNVTTLTDSSGAFTTAMEGQKITLESAGEFTITSRLSSTQITVSGDAGGTTGEHYVVITTEGRLWVTDDASDAVYVYSTSGELKGQWYLDPANSDPSGIVLDPDSNGQYAPDGRDLWVLDQVDKKLYKYAGGALWTSGGRETSTSVTLGESGNSAPTDVAVMPGEWRIDWGDGTPVQPVNAGLSSVSHYYADDDGQPFTISAGLVDTIQGFFNQSMAVGNKSVTVTNAAPTLNTDFSYGVVGTNLYVEFSGTFTDAGFTRGGTPASETFTLSIDWDGEGGSSPEIITPQIVNGSDGRKTLGTFFAAHEYAAGDWTAIVKVEDDDGGYDYADGTVNGGFSFSIVGFEVVNSINVEQFTGNDNCNFTWVGPNNEKPNAYMDISTVEIGPLGAHDDDGNWVGDGKVQIRGGETGIAGGDHVVFARGNWISTYKNGGRFIGFDNDVNIANNYKVNDLVSGQQYKFLVVDSTSDAASGGINNTIFAYNSGGTETGNVSYHGILESGTGVKSRPMGACTSSDGANIWTIEGPKPGKTVSPLVTLWEGTQDVVQNMVGSWEALADGLTNPTGITTDDTNLWIVDATSKKVFVFVNAASSTSPVSGEKTGQVAFSLVSANNNPTDIVTDGELFYVTQNNATGNDEVFVYDSRGQLIDRWQLAPGNNENRNVTGITLDASNPNSTTIWTVDLTDHKVYAYTDGRSRGVAGRQLNDNDSPFALANGNEYPQGIADPPALSGGGQGGAAMFFQEDVEAEAVQANWVDNGDLYDVLAGAGMSSPLSEMTSMFVAGGAGGLSAGGTTFASDIDWPHMTDVTTAFTQDYGRTSFNQNQNIVYAELELDCDGINWRLGPMVVLVKNIDNLSVSLHDPDGYAPDGSPYYIVDDVTIDGGTNLLTSGRLELAFENPQRVTFHYDLVVMMCMNRPPEFTTTPVVTVYAGRSWQYRPGAVDPDGDAVTISVDSKPVAMVWQEGLLSWSPGTSDIGPHVIVLQAMDGYGGRDEQVFSLNVLENPGNHPPRFTSDPVCQVYVGTGYEYQATAEDPDGDDLTFSVVDGPTGLSIGGATGLVIWQPTGEDVGRTVNVTLKVVDDGSPVGQATQTYQILVLADPRNTPPHFTTEPPERFDIWSSTSPQVTGGTIDETIDPNLGAIHGQTWIDLNADGIRNSGDLPGSWIELVERGDPVMAPNDDGSSDELDLGFTLEFYNQAWTTCYVNNNGNVTFGGPLWAYTPSGFPISDGGPNPIRMIAPFWGDVDTRGGFGEVCLARGTSSRGYRFVQIDWTDTGYYNIHGDKLNTFTLYIEDDPDGDIVAFIYGHMQWTTGDASGGWGGFGGGGDYGYAQVGFDSGDGEHYTSYMRLGTQADVDAISNTMRLFRISGGDMPVPWVEPGVDGFTVELVDDGGNVVASQVSQSLDLNADGVIDAYNESGLYRFENVAPGDYTIRQIGRAGWVQSSPAAPTLTYSVHVDADGLIESGVDFGSYRWLFYDSDAFDPDGDELTYSLVSGPGTVDEVTGALEWLPSAAGSYNFVIAVEDGRGGRAEQAFTVVVHDDDVNIAPEISSTPNTHGATGHAYSTRIQAIDNNLDPLVYDLDLTAALPDGMAIDPYTGVITWTPTLAGEYEVIARVRDGRGGEDTQTFRINVIESPVNHPPVFVSDPPLSVVAGGQYYYQIEATDADGDGVGFDLSIHPEGMAVQEMHGYVIWFPRLDQIGIHDVVLRARDTAGGITVQRFQVEVLNPNDPPVITSEPYGPAAAGALWQYQVQASDPNGDPVTLDLATHPAGMTMSAGGLVEWTPLAADEGDHRVVITASDPRGGMVYQGFTLTVSDDGPPIITSVPIGPAIVGNEWTYQVTAMDPDADPLTISLDHASLGRGATIDTDNVIRWTPTDAGDYEFVVTVDDGTGYTTTQTFALTVVPQTVVSQPPVITSVPEGPAYEQEAWSYVLAAYDPDGDSFDWSLGQGAPAGMVINHVGSQHILEWTPPVGAHASSPYSITITATDVPGAVCTQTFRLPVAEAAPANQPPVFTSAPSGPAYVNEAWHYEVLAFDPDNDAVTLSLVTYPANMTLADGVVSWTPTSTSAGETVTVRASDGVVSVDQTFSLPVVARSTGATAITSVPTGPAAVGKQWQYLVVAEDPDSGHTLTYSLVTGPSGMAFNAQAPNLLKWQPAAGAEAGSPYSVSIQVDDGHGNVTVQSFELPVIANDAPVIISIPPAPARVGEIYRYQVEAYDPDGGELAYSLENPPAGMAIDSSGLLQWVPSLSRDYEVIVIVTDQWGAWASQTFVVPVLPETMLNEPPVISSRPTGPAAANVPYHYQVLATDPNGDEITYSLGAGSPGDMSIDSSSGLVTWTPTVGGEFYVCVIASDGLITDSQEFWLPVVGNTPPVITSSPLLTTTVGTAYNYQVAANDPNPGDNAGLKYTLEDAPGGMSIGQTSGALNWTPLTIGVYAVNIIVTDAHDAWTRQSYQLRVTSAGANQNPTISPDARDSIQFGQIYLHEVAATDPDGEALTYTLTAAPAGMTIDESTGMIQWQTLPSDLDPANPKTFTVRAEDPRGGWAQQSFNVYVVSEAENTSPQIMSSPSLVGNVGQWYHYSATATDAEHDPIDWFLVSSPQGMSITEDGRVTWQPSAAQIGGNEVIVAVMDVYGGMATQTFTINVSGANSAPIFDNVPPTRAIYGQPYTFTMEAHDPDGDAIEFSLSGSNLPQGLGIGATSGVLNWTNPTADATFTILATDEHGLASGLGAFTIRVDPLNTNTYPEIHSTPSIHAFVGRPWQYHVDGYDPEGQNLTYTVIGPSGMQWNSADPTILEWTPGAIPSPNPVSVSVTVADTGNLAVIQTFLLTVHLENYAPQFSLANDAATVGAIYTKSIFATDQDSDDLITFELTQKPGDMAIVQTGPNTAQIVWWPTAPFIGTRDVTVTVTDRAGVHTDVTYQVVVSPDTEDPLMAIDSMPQSVDLNQEVIVHISAQDNVGVTRLALTVDGNPVALHNGYGRFIASRTGDIEVVATAYDDAGNSATDTKTLIVIDRSDSVPPQASISWPDDSIILVAPVDVIGTIDDPNGNDVDYTLYLARVGEDFVQIAEGSGEVNNGIIGQVDPTTLEPGFYTLLLTATDIGGNTSSTTKSIKIGSALRLGNFNLSFTDLEIPVAGIPITIERTYDTLKANRDGDFGYGWDMGMFSLRVQTDFVPQTIDDWLYDFSGLVQTGWDYGVRLTVNMPDGSSQGFTFTPVDANPGNPFQIPMVLKASFTADPGVTSTLTVTNPGLLLGYFDGLLATWYDNEPYNPATLGLDYILTTSDGAVYRFAGTDGKLKTVAEPGGNTIEISSDSVRAFDAQHQQTAAVTIVRDGGRIVKIVDPANKEIVYGYDANGDLRTVTNRELQVVGYNYDSTRPHFLGEIVRDPLGTPTTVMQVNYDPMTGRLTGMTDASGARCSFGYTLNLGNNLFLESIADAFENTTEIVRDARGNVVRQIAMTQNAVDPAARKYSVTVFDYYGDNRLKRQSAAFEVIGFDNRLYQTPATIAWAKRVEYNYYSSGQVMTETIIDAMDHKSYTTYDEFGRPLEIVDALGNATINEYTDGNLSETRTQTGVDASNNPIYNITRYEYVNGKLTRVVQIDGDGDEVVMSSQTYDAAGRISSTTNASGVVQYYVYDANGRQVISYQRWEGTNDNQPIYWTIANRSAYDFEGRVVNTYQYEEEGLQVYASVDDLPGAPLWSTTTHYNGAGLVDWSTDRLGVKTTNVYDSRGLLIETYTQAKNALGVDVYIVTRTAYDANGRAIYATDPHEETISNGLPVAAPAYGTRTQYDGMGRVVLEERRQDMLLVINASGNCVLSGSDASSPISFSATHYNGLGQVDVVTFDSDGIASVSDDDDYTTTYTYDAAGRQLSVTTDRDADADADDRSLVLYEYDAAGRQSGVTQDNDGDLSTSTDRVTTGYEYDGAGRMTKTLYPDPDGAGQGVDTDLVVVYDILGRRVAQTDQMGNLTRYEYNDAGLLTAVILPEVVNPDTGLLVHPRYEYEYDDYGNQTLIRDNVFQTSAGINSVDARETVFKYDEFGRLIKRQLPLGSTEENGYYGQGSLDHQIGQIKYHVDFQGMVTAYEYDSLGRVANKKYYDSKDDYSASQDLKQTITYTYDSTGSVVTIDDTLNKADATYTYNSAGRLESVQENGHTINYEYDEGTGLLIRTYTNTSTDPDSDIQYDYDTLGRLWTVTVDDRNSVDITDEVTTYAYDHLGNLKSVVYANGNVTDYVYDDLSRLTKVTQWKDSSRHPGADELAVFEYTLRKDGMRIQAVEMDNTGNQTCFKWSYDSLGRLTAEEVDFAYNGTFNDDRHAVYTFDLVGNRLEQATDTNGDGTADQVATYTYDDNDRLLLEQLDTDGDLITEQTTVYTYGPSNAWTVLTDKTVWQGTDTNPATGTKISEATSAYDYQGRLETMTVNAYTAGSLSKSERYTYTYFDGGARTKQEYRDDADLDGDFNEHTADVKVYVVDGNNGTGYSQVFEEWNGATLEKSYTIGQDVIAQWDAPNGQLYLLADGHGSTRLLTASDGTVKQASAQYQYFTYDAYGNMIGTVPGTILTTLLYSGEQRDLGTGLDYLRARYYDPTTGRFTQFDSYMGRSQDPASLHKYLYANASPVAYSDPSGQFACYTGLLAGSSISAYLRAHWVGMTVRFALSLAVNLAVQLRLRSILGPLAEEADNLALALLPINAGASRTVSQIAEEIRTKMNIQLGLAIGSVVATTINSYIGWGLTAIRSLYAAWSVISLYERVLRGVSYDDGGKFFSVHGKLDISCIKGLTLGDLKPAEDLKELTRFFTLVQNRQVGLAKASYLKFARSLGKYGEFEGIFGFRGVIVGQNGAAAGVAATWFKSGPNNFQTGVQGVGAFILFP